MPAPAWVGEALEGQPALMTVPEVCSTIRTSRRNLYRLIASARLESLKQTEGGSSRLLIPRESVERYLLALAGAR